MGSFISSIKRWFHSAECTQEFRKVMRIVYLENPDFAYQKISLQPTKHYCLNSEILINALLIYAERN